MLELQQDRHDARAWGEGWVLSCVSAAGALPAPCLGGNGRQVVFLHQAEGVDVFSCPNLTARCAAQFDRRYPSLKILTAVTCWCALLFPAAALS